MSDTINREYATRYFIGLQALDKITNDNYDGKITFEEVVSRLGVIPSAQPEIIQCKDCKYRKVNEHYGEKGYMNLKAICELDTGDIFQLGRYAEEDDWFCADAERREGDADE